MWTVNSLLRRSSTLNMAGVSFLVLRAAKCQGYIISTERLQPEGLYRFILLREPNAANAPGDERSSELGTMSLFQRETR